MEETFSMLPTLCAGNSLVTVEFPSQRPVKWSFNVFFDLHLNKRLSKQLRRQWFGMPSYSLWHHCIFLLFYAENKNMKITFTLCIHEAVCPCPLRWRHNELDGVSDHQPNGCLLNRLFRCRSKKTSKLRVTGLCVGNSPGPVNSPHKGPVMRNMFPFDDVIMQDCPLLLWIN